MDVSGKPQLNQSRYFASPVKTLMVNWVLLMWDSITSETIQSFEVWGETRYDPAVIHCTKEGVVAKDAKGRLLTLSSQPNDADNADDKEDILNSDAEFTESSGNSVKDQGMDMGSSKDEVVHEHNED